jgi:hypothetical protein
MQYYNVILQHYQQTVTISKKPSDTAYLEVVEVVREQNGNPISYAEAASKACNRNEQVKYYLGDNNKKLDLEKNWKLRPILELLRKNHSIGVNDGKPIVLWWKENKDNNIDAVRKNTSLLAHNTDEASSSERLCTVNVVENISKSEVSEVSEVQKGVSTQENSQDHGKGITEENKILAVKSQISHNTEKEEEGNSSSSRRTLLERKTTEDALNATSETSDSSDSTVIHIGHSPVSCKSDTPTIVKGEVIDKNGSGHMQIRHSKSACVLTSADIDSSNDEEEAGS